MGLKTPDWVAAGHQPINLVTVSELSTFFAWIIPSKETYPVMPCYLGTLKIMERHAPYIGNISA
jgi:hypothetical protein